MKINWFPGHMKKALDEMAKELDKVDIIIYVLDSRAPKSCLNPKLTQLANRKPILYILNKIDLTDIDKLEIVKNDFKSNSSDFLMINSTQSMTNSLITSKIRSLCREKIKKYEQRGVAAVLRAIVVGVPNSGKSTFVNNLCKKAKAVTGDRPGVTKSKQWFLIGNNVEVCDTPGTLYPNLEDQEVAKSLAFIGSIKDEVMDEVEVASELLKRLDKCYPDVVKERYKNATSLEDIAKIRAFLMPGGELDISRAANAVISDFRTGKLGKLMIGA